MLPKILLQTIAIVVVIAVHSPAHREVEPVVATDYHDSSTFATPPPGPGGPVQPPTSTSSPTPTASRTPTASPTSFRVADLAVTVDDDADPVLPGQTFHYLLNARNLGPALATSASLFATLDPAAGIRFTGVISPPNMPPQVSCVVMDAQHAACSFAPLFNINITLEAMASETAPPGTAGMCGELKLTVSSGTDPDPSNNKQCEETVIQARRGDCNADGAADAGDLSAIALEIFDGDGSTAAGAPGGTYAGSSIGCDPNMDGSIDAADISCAVLIIFGGPGACP